MTECGTARYGASTISYRVQLSARRRKTVQIALDGRTGILVSAPTGVAADEIAAIVRKRAPWILRTVPAALLRPERTTFVSGDSLPYLGRQVRMAVTDEERPDPEIRFRYWGFEVRVPHGQVGEARHASVRRAFVRWYRARALARLTARVQVWSRLLGLTPTKLLIREQKQRWASCSVDGTLRFNWRVVMTAPALFDYVVVHELAHLEVKNHSPQFWARVATVIPDYELRRRQLRETGPYLTF